MQEPSPGFELLNDVTKYCEAVKLNEQINKSTVDISYLGQLVNYTEKDQEIHTIKKEYIYIYIYTHTHALARSLARSLARTLALTHSLTHARSHSLTHSRTLARTPHTQHHHSHTTPLTPHFLTHHAQFVFVTQLWKYSVQHHGSQ